MKKNLSMPLIIIIYLLNYLPFTSELSGTSYEFIMNFYLALPFILLGLFVQRFTRRIKEPFLEILLRAYLRFIFLSGGLIGIGMGISSLMISILNDKIRFEREYLLGAGLLILIMAIIITFLIEILYNYARLSINEYEKMKPGKKNIGSKLAILIVVLIAFTLPDLIFGTMYNLVSLMNPEDNFNIEKYSKYDFYYLSFVIHYALPLTSEPLTILIKYINSDPLARLVEILHINISKFIDIAIITSLLGNFFTFPKKKPKKSI